MSCGSISCRLVAGKTNAVLLSEMMSFPTTVGNKITKTYYQRGVIYYMFFYGNPPSSGGVCGVDVTPEDPSIG